MKSKHAEVIKKITKLIEKNQKILSEIESESDYKIEQKIKEIFIKEILEMKKSTLKKIISSGLSKNVSQWSYANKDVFLSKIFFIEKDVRNRYSYYRNISYSFCNKKTMKELKKIDSKKDFKFIIRCFSEALNICCRRYKKMFMFCLKHANGSFLINVISRPQYNSVDIYKHYFNIMKSKKYSSLEKNKIIEKLSDDQICYIYKSDIFSSFSQRLKDKIKTKYTIILISNLKNYKEGILEDNKLIYNNNINLKQSQAFSIRLNLTKNIPSYIRSLSKKEKINIIRYLDDFLLIDNYNKMNYGIYLVISNTAREIMEEIIQYMDKEDCIYLMDKASGKSNWVIQKHIETIMKSNPIWS